MRRGKGGEERETKALQMMMEVCKGEAERGEKKLRNLSRRQWAGQFGAIFKKRKVSVREETAESSWFKLILSGLV